MVPATYKHYICNLPQADTSVLNCLSVQAPIVLDCSLTDFVNHYLAECMIMGSIPLECSWSTSMIRDHSDHGASKEPMQIHSEQGFTGFFDVSRSERSWSRIIPKERRLCLFQHKCCGSLSYSSWNVTTWKQMSENQNLSVPNSCCKTITPACGKRDHPSNIYREVWPTVDIARLLLK